MGCRGCAIASEGPSRSVTLRSAVFYNAPIWDTHPWVLPNRLCRRFSYFFLRFSLRYSPSGLIASEQCFVSNYVVNILFMHRTRNYIRGFVHPSVRWSVGWWTRVKKWGNERFRTFLVADSCISAPAHPSATDGRVSGLVFSRVICRWRSPSWALRVTFLF